MPIWKKIGVKSGIDKLIMEFNIKIIPNEEIKIIVNEIHSSWFFLSKITVSVRYLNKIRKIDVIARLLPIITSWKKPIKNKIVLEGFISNLVIQIYNIIEIKFGFAVLNNEKRLKDVWRFIKKNKIIKNNRLLENE